MGGRARPAPRAVKIRPAVEADLPAILAIEQASFADPWRLSAFREALTTERHILLVATDPVVVGYCVGLKVADEAELGNLAVVPDQRGRGIGEALLRAFLATVDAAPPLPAVYLEVRASNMAAQRLYARAGFVPAGVRRDYYEHPREDALVLRRPPGSVGG